MSFGKRVVPAHALQVLQIDAASKVARDAFVGGHTHELGELRAGFIGIHGRDHGRFLWQFQRGRLDKRGLFRVELAAILA